MKIKRGKNVHYGHDLAHAYDKNMIKMLNTIIFIKYDLLVIWSDILTSSDF